LAEFEKERAAAAELLLKLVGATQKRTELEKKVDLSKCVDVETSAENGLLVSGYGIKSEKPQTGFHAKQQTKSKAKAIDINELRKQQGVLTPSEQPRQFNRPNPGNRKLNANNRQFPQLGEEPSPQKNYTNYQNQGNNENSGDRQQQRPPRQQGQYQGQGQQGQNQDQRPPRQQGQGQQQRPPRQQGQQGSNNQRGGQGQSQGPRNNNNNYNKNNNNKRGNQDNQFHQQNQSTTTATSHEQV